MPRALRTANKPVTVNEFYRLVPDGQKADLLDGVIHMASPDTRRSNRLANFIQFVLMGFIAAREISGEVYASRFAFRLSKVRAPEPDMAYVCPERLHLVAEQAMDGGPDVAVEIVSRDSRTRDYVAKKEVYRKAGVREYWIIDPLKRQAEFYRLRSGRYERVALEDGHIFRSQVVPGFWLDVDWLFAKPLPNPYACLQQILWRQ